MNKKLLPITFSILFIVSCGGGGGGGGSTPTSPTTPDPTVNLSAEPTSVVLESTSTLTWSSTNATSCSASWTSQTGTSGSEAVTITAVGDNTLSISCTGAGGTRSASVTVEGYRETDGVVVDGYISGAEVCIDEDESWTCDSNENTTTSDNEGKFTIKYANGNLVSIGGTDLDSQTLLDNLLITHKLTGHSDFKAVTPVTSIAAFMEDASLVNAALGIDSSIDVFTFDPVANKGDGGIYDYLYEKGNQLTVLAFALQNITNNLNTTTETTQDYFKAITEEIEKEYTETETKVDIETEAFVTKVLENVITTKSVTIDETAKANTAKALAGVMPVIEVKSEDDLTTAVIRFAISTLQTDIQSIANGTATAETVTSYTEDLLTYIAEDQSVDSGQIAPDINAIADTASTSEDAEVQINVLLNDSYVTSSPFSLSATNGSNGSTSISNNLVIYSPDANYNGSDSFTYTITQKDKTSSADVTLTIEAVNDAPSIDIASIIQVQENQTAVTTVSVSDVDEDELTLTLGGTDADSFNLSSDNVLSFKEAPDYETKTSYSIALTLTDGIETVTKDINLNIQDIGEFYGSAIDGYISGANIFIDQNFNFLKDEGELSAITDSDGKFEIFTEDLSLYECLKNRPIVADVPVGAVDSTLGEVTKAYQMILPSLNDSGPEKVVVSPFSSLFSEQITNAIADLKLENELTIAEGCQSIGDNIASNISIKIQELKSTLDSLGVTYDELTDNFISSPNGIISETTAQNIAQFLPSITSIKSILNTEMSNNFGFEINPSLIIGQDTINLIFDPNRVEDITEAPLTLFTSFSSETNTSGWYKQSTIIANGSKLDSISNLIPYKCYSSNSQDCLEKDITLDVLANYSKDYRNSVGWFRSVNKNNPISIGLVVNGSIEVSSGDVRYYDDSNEITLHSCGVEEIIQLTGSKVNEIGHAYQYQTNYNEGTGLQNGCNISSDFRRATIEIRKFGTDVNGNEESLSTSYVTNNIDTSNLFSSKPVNLFNDFENVDPLGIINEIASLEFNFSKFSSIRSSLASGERSEFRYSLRHSNGQFSKQYVLTLSSMSANDSFLLETYDENGTITSTNNISGIGALQSYSNQILDEASNASSIINNNYYSNESPVITSTNTFSAAENQTAIGTVTATDAEGDDVTFIVSGSELAITSAGVLTFVSVPDYETKTSYTATVTASDGVNPTTQDITVDVTNVNESPVITSTNTFSAAENQTAIGTVTATDAEGDDVTFIVSGSELAITSAGVLTFVSVPDYETKTSYTATVTASDGVNPITQDITVDVTNVNESPVITSTNTFSAAENQTAIGTVTATDAEGDDVTFIVSGSELAITSAGVLTFVSVPDYETKTSYTATVTASDGVNPITQDITVNITDVNEMPTFRPTGFTINENLSSLDVSSSVSDEDGDTITYSLGGGDGGLFNISSAGVLTLKTGQNFDYELQSSYSFQIGISDGTNSQFPMIGIEVNNLNDNSPVFTSSSTLAAAENQTSIDTVTATDADGDSVTFTVSGSELVITSAGVLTFKTAPDYETKSTYTATVTASDGVNPTTQDITVDVTNVNESPVITSTNTFSAAENQTAIGTVTATDAEGDDVTFIVSGSELAITSAGVLTFVSVPDYETKTSYTATVTASDGVNPTTQNITVNVTNVVENSSPIFTSNSSFTVAENQTSAANITVTDADSDSISFSLSGTDADSFAISSSGALTFNNAPDYETKESYSLIITASDGSASVSQTINISITNVNEVPQISALSSTQTPDENQKSIVTVSASDPDSNTNLTYSISGTDSSLFSISSSGVLIFKAAPDYETPSDADADNSYQINVVVSDGSLSVTQAVTIQVQNVADLISGVAVDGYVAGATVFQDLNNDGDLDSGEPSAATNSLGSFSLNLSSVNINAPVRIYNGFDLASNEIHPSIMDISVSETGSYIVTPISTLVGRLKIEDTSLTAMVPQSMIAGALGISLADSPNDSILGFDPIAYFNGSDTTLASEARPVFAASQLLMTMGGGNYSVHKYITDQVLSSLSSTLTTAAGSSITLSSANDILGLKQDAYDAIFNGYVDTALANNPPINSIQFRNNKAVMTDYLNGSSSSAVNYSLYGVHDGTTTLVADLVGAKLDYDNLKQILDNDGTGTPMDLNFELANIPAAGSGSTGVTLKLFYGDDTTQDSDEDYLQITLTANWESDGTNFKIKLPASSSIKASFYDRGGTVLSITPTNQVEDIFTVTKDGPNRPATLSLRLSKLFNAFPTEVTGLSSFLDGAAEFTYLVEFDNFTIYDHLDNTFTKIQGTFEVNANPAITVFADDIYVHENATSKDISFYLSHASSSDVTLDYAIADASTASSSDYSLSSGTVTIPAGSMSATLSIPVTNDTTVETQEEIRLTLSNVQNAVLGRSSVSAFITDGEEILANSTQKAILADNIFKDSKASINAYIKNKLDTSTVTISGSTNTYSLLLINNSITTDVYKYIDSIVDDYEVLSETLISTIMTKADAYIDAQLSSFADYTAFATALTQLNSGIKGLNMSQIVGTNINSNGTFPSGQNATTLQTALDGKVDTLVTLAADTVADILGTDTNTNFPNANVVMGTDGDDTITGTSGSDLIASFGGTDTVNSLAGNDKILGGAGVDTLNGGDNDDHIYGYAGNDVLNGNDDADKILGGKDNDTINGGAGDDDLRGEAGDDTITTGAGSDTVSGGLGDDTIIIDAL